MVTSHKRGHRLNVEQLEHRAVPAAGWRGAFSSLLDSHARAASAQGDTVLIRKSGSNVLVLGTNLRDVVDVQIRAEWEWFHVHYYVDIYAASSNGNFDGRSYEMKGGVNVNFLGFDGDDDFTNNPLAGTDIGVRCTAHGGRGNDTFTNNGSKLATFLGDEDNDTLVGGSSRDVLEGNGGSDNLDGRNGDDILRGGSNSKKQTDDLADTLRGGAGDDNLSGGLGNDELYGEDNNDTIRGGVGEDALYGGLGEDVLAGQADMDIHCGGTQTQYPDGEKDTLISRDNDRDLVFVEELFGVHVDDYKGDTFDFVEFV